MTKKIKKEPDAIDKVVDYFLENIDNPQDLFKGNTIFQEFCRNHIHMTRFWFLQTCF
ncbi:hypothetical protein [Spiroplasma endosymbiont of Clivina fossor]|uniref:hypothetical protein n=1 Tax=Spiroplasma endosymbiont of Clivina fossor TaxID=3066282 RepID=UPI00313DB70E